MPAEAHNVGMIAAQVTPVTHLESGAASLTLWLIVGFVLLGGVVAAFGRSLLEGSFKSRSSSVPGKGGAGRTTPNVLAFGVGETLGSRDDLGKLDACGDICHTWFAFTRLRQGHWDNPGPNFHAQLACARPCRWVADLCRGVLPTR